MGIWPKALDTSLITKLRGLMQPLFSEIKAKNLRTVNVTLKGLFDNFGQQRSQGCLCSLSFLMKISHIWKI